MRPPGGSTNPYDTNPQYCVFDQLHQDYAYTPAWVQFLIEKMKDEDEFASLYEPVGALSKSQTA